MTDYPDGTMSVGGYPTPETVKRAYDDAGLHRAVQCSRSFYPTVYFGPTPSPEGESRRVKTIPGKGWFVYFRIDGPDEPAFDGSWQLPDVTTA
jgi:hypothetical protein